jgi:hypothetical protein
MKILLKIIIFLITVTYFFISNKTIYVLTLKYYSLFRYISDDRESLIKLNRYVITYRIIIRYVRIHLVASSILLTFNFIIEMSPIVNIIKISIALVVILIIYDLLSFEVRLKALEDKIYRTYYRIK